MATPSVRTSTEETRIASAYERRRAVGDTLRDSFLSPANLAIIQERERAMLRALNRAGYANFAERKLLEVGCGTGFWLRQFVHWRMPPANVTAVELLPERASEARSLLPADVQIIDGNGTALPFQDASFDIVLQSVVFSSILDSEVKEQVAREMMRVLRPGGLILWYDFFVNNPRNPDVRGVSRSEINNLFPGCTMELQRLTLAPPLARVVAPIFPPLYGLLSSIRVLCTHYLGLIRKNEQQSD
jgi:ubiquinone/menaquinone biosynthesis C-methylase UbiE